MKKRVMVWFIIFVMCFAALTLVGCAQERNKGNGPQGKVTLLAKVEDVRGDTFWVRGLTEGFESEYTFSTTGGTRVYREGEEDIAAEIVAGDIVSVTFSGSVAETYPGVLQDVTEVVKMNG